MNRPAVEQRNWLGLDYIFYVELSIFSLDLLAGSTERKTTKSHQYIHFFSSAANIEALAVRGYVFLLCMCVPATNKYMHVLGNVLM